MTTASRDWAARLIDRIDHAAARPDDPPDERLIKSILMFLGVFAVLASAVAGGHFGSLGATAVAWLFGAAAALSLAGLVHFVTTKDRGPFQWLALALLALVPLAAQHLLGGFAAAGGLGLWTMLAPLATLMFQTPRQATWWFGGFVVLAFAAALAEPGGGRGPSLWFTQSLLLAASLVFILLRHFVAERARFQALLLAEQAKSEALLLNILPGPIAERLKRDPKAIADNFAEVSVLFADIVGFTQMAARTTPTELVALLNDLFSRFDSLAAHLGVEKIKTIGDAYMACAGLPVHRPDHAEVIAELAFGMQQAIADFCRDRGVAVQIRIGINSGPVVAGVIGTRKFIYDLWGDTVNTASRMESHGVPGGIQVTAATRDRLGDGYRYESRGEIEVKGKGKVATFLLLGKS